MLTLVDTSVWIDHLHRSDPELVSLLNDGLVFTHPMVIGELAVGSMPNRELVIESLGRLPSTTVASYGDVLALIEANGLHGRGLAYVDVQLLAATLVSPEVRLWSRDRRLAQVAAELGIAA